MAFLEEAKNSSIWKVSHSKAASASAAHCRGWDGKEREGRLEEHPLPFQMGLSFPPFRGPFLPLHLSVGCLSFPLVLLRHKKNYPVHT